MKIEWDKEKNVIYVGRAAFESYTNFKSAVGFAFQICEANGIPTSHLKTQHAANGSWNEEGVKPKATIRERNAVLGNMLGCSASVLFKHFMKLQNKAFITPVYDIYKTVKAYKPWKKDGWDASVLQRVNENRALLQAVQQDGLTNILPVVYHLLKSPQELKKEFGNSWKIVANNSVTRNKHLGSLLRYKKDVESRKAIVRAEIPSTLLAKPVTHTVEELLWLKNNFKGKWGKSDEMYHAVCMFQDTRNMAEQVGVKFNPNWTSRRMKEMHDKFSADITARKYSKDVFDSVKNVPVRTLEHEGYVATLLKSAFEIADEGNSMGHCVAGYAESVRGGNYLVYSITKRGERSSTLGVRVPIYREQVPNPWRIDQHYGKYNQRLSDENEIKLGKMIVEMLNKEME